MAELEVPVAQEPVPRPESSAAMEARGQQVQGLAQREERAVAQAVRVARARVAPRGCVEPAVAVQAAAAVAPVAAPAPAIEGQVEAPAAPLSVHS